MRAKRIEAEEFIRVWQGAENVEQVAERTGLYHAVCVTRARSYRARGVPLRELRKGNQRRRDWAALRALAEQLAPRVGEP